MKTVKNKIPTPDKIQRQKERRAGREYTKELEKGYRLALEKNP